jgi:hypothetical protein
MRLDHPLAMESDAASTGWLLPIPKCRSALPSALQAAPAVLTLIDPDVVRR